MQQVQLSNNLHYLLVSTCDGPASTICRQNMQGNGFEKWRLIHVRYTIPLGTRSIRYLTRLLKPQLDEQKFEERASQPGGFNSPGMNRTTTHCYQTQSRLQYRSTKRDKRTTSATSTASSRKHHNICTDQIHGDRVLQSNSIIHQAATTKDRHRWT